MSDFLDVLQQLGTAFMQLWELVPESAQQWTIRIAVGLMAVAIVAAVNHGLTYRVGNALAKTFEPDFNASPITERRSDGSVHRRNPSPADKRRQCRKCFHVLALPDGYMVFISAKAAYGKDTEAVKELAKKADKSMAYTVKERWFGGFQLRCFRNANQSQAEV